MGAARQGALSTADYRAVLRPSELEFFFAAVSMTSEGGFTDESSSNGPSWRARRLMTESDRMIGNNFWPANASVSRKDDRLAPTRRGMLKTVGAGAAAWAFSNGRALGAATAKTHLVTLSFDDGFKKSSLRTAEIYEKFGLAACINVIATAHQPGFVLPNEYHRWSVGDFGLWNELLARGHEIMPHGYKHADKSKMPLSEAQDLIRRCLDAFSKELKGFDRRKAVFNFPFNASTPEVEKWLAGEVMAFRTGGPAINPLPHRGQQKLTCTSYGPDNIDAHLTGEIDRLLAGPPGWLIYNTHGLDDEGWGPLRAATLEKLLERLTAIPTVAVVPAGRALVAVS
jgi:peptidoglycan/xylan/chitin deacetylase (PgdA/CDA1 family)